MPDDEAQFAEGIGKIHVPSMDVSQTITGKMLTSHREIDGHSPTS